MLRVLMWAPDWDNRWMPYFKKELGSHYDFTFTSESDPVKVTQLSINKDLFISMWADGIINLWSLKFPRVPIIAYLRRYELFSPGTFPYIRFDKVSALIFCNDAVQQGFNAMCERKPKRQYLIYNSVDIDQFPLVTTTGRKRTRIAMVCKETYIKNVPLAAMILNALPSEYTIHHIGDRQFRGHGEMVFYLESLGCLDRWLWDDPIPAAQMPEWYADKDFILSTSINEGNPNNVIEGMACGLKPIVHAWPGAGTQFPSDAIFRTAEEAAQMIREGAYQPLQYRKWVEDHYSLDNIRQIHKVIEDVL